MPIGTTRKPQTLTRKNATPASSILRQPLGGFAPDTASYMEYMPQRMGAPVPTTSPLSQGFSQAPSPQGLMGLINNINGLVAQSQQQFQAGRNQSPVNWRYPTQSPLVRSPVANRQSMLAGQASTITGMQQAEKAGQGWMLTGNRGDMPTFVARNRPEDVMAEFVATHMDGLRDKALSRVPSGPLTLRTPGGQLQQQMGYIDGQGQKTATNRLGALRQLAMQNPNDADVMGALAAAENDFKAQMADRSSPATVAANREKIGARNDAKRGRAQRQAEGLRNLFGYGPRSPLSKKQMSGAQTQSPLSSRSIEAQAGAAQRIASRSDSIHFLGADMTGGEERKSHLANLDRKIQERMTNDPNAEFSDDMIKAWQDQARDFSTVGDQANDPFYFAGSQDWKELASMPDNPRSRASWFEKYKKNVAARNAMKNAPPFISTMPPAAFGISGVPGAPFGR